MISDDLGVSGDSGQGNSPPDLRSSDLPSKRLLGKGLASVGYETEWKGVRYARKDFVAVPSDIFRREAVVLLALPDHENVVKTHGLTVDRLSCSLVLDYMDDMLTELIQKRKDLHEWSPAGEHGPSLQESLGVIIRIARAVEHLHKHGMSHGDLKPRNVLVTYRNDGDKSLLVKSVKVADFGLVQTKRNSMPYGSHQARKLDMVRWKAPENLTELYLEATSPDLDSDSDSDEDFIGSACATHSDDAYCFGLTCFQILTGEEPYPKPNWKELVQDIVSNKPGLKLPRNLFCHQELQELLDVCWDADPDKRPTFSYICEKLEHIHSLQPTFHLSTGRMAPIDAALKIIESVKDTAENVLVNKAQCKRLAERFGVVGKALEGLEKEQYEDTILKAIVAVLEKGKSLVESYEDERNAIKNVLYRAENHAAFREVHDEIDNLKTYLDLDHADIKGELTTSQTDNNMLLDDDARIDREEMLPSVQRAIPNRSGSSVEQAEGDVKNIEKEVLDIVFNAEKDADELSYLDIPFESEIVLKGAIKELKPYKERMSKGDEHLDGMALVEKGTWNGVDCAVKVFKSDECDWNTEELRKEIASLVKLRHPHVTQLIGRSQHNGKTYVLYEMMDSDLRVLIESRKKKNVLPNFLQDNRPFSRAREVSIITQIARGMFYLHEKGFVHGELKCTNLLVKQLGEHIDVKVADFHCSRELGKAATATTKYKPAHRARWMPPEDFQHCSGVDLEHPTDELLMKGDVYSFAMTCYEVVTGKYPFDGVRGDEAIQEKVKREIRPELPKDLSEDLKNLIVKCWHQDPEERPSFQDICYVLKVLAVNLSQAPTLIDRLNCFGVGRVAPEFPTTQDWSKVLNQPIPKAVQDDDIGAAKDLPHYLKIKPSDLKPLQRLGKGASAVVFAASWIGCRFAVKWLSVDHVKKLRNEVSILMKLLHPHVIRLVGFSVLENRCAIVMELLDMSLEELMKKRGTPFSEAEALAIIRKLALGMDFLHSRGVTHGDLKPANVLVRNERLKAGMDVKIVDFGLSRLLGESTSEKVLVLGRYRAPEVILSMETKEHVGDPKAADVYSFALVCFEVITGKKPYFDCKSDTTAAAVAKGGAPPKLRVQDRDRAHQDLWQLIEKCWSKEPEGRPKFVEVVKELDRMCRS